MYRECCTQSDLRVDINKLSTFQIIPTPYCNRSNPLSPTNMKFSGADLMVATLQADMVVVSRNVFTADALERAAIRLLRAWPMLSFRTNVTVSSSWSECDFDHTDGVHSTAVQRKPLPNLLTTAC
jgi:hypothetical protein